MLSDIKTGKVSNRLILSGMAAGIIINGFMYGKVGIMHALSGITAPVIILFLLFLINGLGAGDIKLFAVTGAFLGARAVMSCIIISFLAGGISAILKIIYNHNFIPCLKSTGMYLVNIVMKKNLSCIERTKNNTIHFTIPIFISVLVYLGLIR